MIKSHTVYNLYCDGCNRMYSQTSDSEFRLMTDAVSLGGWEDHFGLIYCYTCTRGETHELLPIL
jgi:hypothetical protein